LNESPVVAGHGFPLWSSVLIVTLVAAFLLLPGLPDAWRVPSAAGLVISGMISVSGYYIMRRAAHAPTRTFLRLVLGGILGRLFGGLGAVTAAIAWLKLEALPLTVACLGSYAVLSIFEYRALFRHLTAKDRT